MTSFSDITAATLDHAALGWMECYRGAVGPADCDVSEHMNIASYFERFDIANTRLLNGCGLHRSGPESAPSVVERRAGVRFHREMVAGDVLHIESAVTHMAHDHLYVRNRVLDSGTGVLNAECEHQFQLVGTGSDVVIRDLPPDRPGAFEPLLRDFAEPSLDADLHTSGLTVTDRGIASKPGEIGVASLIAAFSDATLQTLAATGMTRGFRDTNRLGFAAIEMQVYYFDARRPGRPVQVRTAIRSMGITSMRILHRISDLESGSPVASLSQTGVCLDLDARRPVEFRDSVRAAAKGWLVLPPTN